MRVVGVSGMRPCGAVLDARCPAPSSLALLAAQCSAPSPLALLAAWPPADGSLAPLAVRCSAPKVVAQRCLSRSTVLSTPLAMPLMGLGRTAPPLSLPSLSVADLELRPPPAQLLAHPHRPPLGPWAPSTGSSSLTKAPPVGWGPLTSTAMSLVLWCTPWNAS